MKVRVLVVALLAAWVMPALAEGEAVIRMTAGDGLYQVVSECRTRILTTARVAVSLTVSPILVEVGQGVTLTCSSAGTEETTTLAIEQVDGDAMTLVDVADGVASFTPETAGDLTFECIGETDDGERSDADVVTVVVVDGAGDVANDNENLNDDGDENVNDNTADDTNDNTADNANDNDSDGNMNDSAPDDGNDNEADNANDNTGRTLDRPK